VKKGACCKAPLEKSVEQLLRVHLHCPEAGVERPALSTPTVNIVAVGVHALPGAASDVKPGEGGNSRRRLVLALLVVNSVARQSSLGHGGSGVAGSESTAHGLNIPPFRRKGKEAGWQGDP
jgi:hypothetical protein